MHRVFLIVALLVASALPTRGEMMLYATAASQQRIDGFPLSDDGNVAGEPRIQQATASQRPKRLIANGCTLYSLEEDRVEVFRVGPTGGLTLIGATRRSDNMKGDDIALSEDQRTLYVPFRIADLLAAYPLGPDGAPNFDTRIENGVPAGGPTSCAYAAANVAWEDIAVTNGKLYATTSSRLNVYGLGAAGQILGTGRIAGDLDNDGTIEPDEQEEDN